MASMVRGEVLLPSAFAAAIAAAAFDDELVLLRLAAATELEEGELRSTAWEGRKEVKN
jgi:hypothetical protein